MSKEAIDKALAALEYIEHNYMSLPAPAEKAITALREALAEQPAQQQEPVVWMYVNKSTHETKFQKHMRDFVDHGLWAEVPLYGEPLANQELNCVCGAVWQGDELVHLPRKPASKPWVGLTDEEKNQVAWSCGAMSADWLEFAEAIEAKLREKNNG